MVFETFAYTILTLLSSVLLLLLSILFLWSKSAFILNRQSPSLPEFQIIEAMAEEASKLLRIHLNKLLQVSNNIAMGRDSRVVYQSSHLSVSHLIYRKPHGFSNTLPHRQVHILHRLGLV
ncbi:hypothetical protein N665_0011s0074 [Sinapis alba]|nr:hypothetical protein N665_0011s0074 [Sinapis alba]